MAYDHAGREIGTSAPITQGLIIDRTGIDPNAEVEEEEGTESVEEGATIPPFQGSAGLDENAPALGIVPPGSDLDNAFKAAIANKPSKSDQKKDTSDTGNPSPVGSK